MKKSNLKTSTKLVILLTSLAIIVLVGGIMALPALAQETPADTGVTADAPADLTPVVVEPETVSPDVTVTETAPADSTVTESAPAAEMPANTPELTTDKADYTPGETVSIFGKFFQSLQNIVLKIFGGSQEENNYTETTQNITVDESGAFTTSYTLDNIYRPLYNVVASAVTGEKLAETSFTDSRTIHSVTLNGGTTVNVAPSSSITVAINVTTSESSNLKNWKSTSYKIGDGSWLCVNTPVHGSAGTFTETFNINAPINTGVYNVSFLAYQEQNCSSNSSNTYILANGITVTATDTTPPVITLIGSNPMTLEYGSTYTEPGATVTDPDDTGLTATISGSVNTSMVGDYTIYYDAVDPAGNHATQMTRTVHVTTKAITITPDVGQSKVFGVADPTFIYTHTPLVGGDFITGALGRASGSDVGTYAYTLNTLTAGSNYSLVMTVSPATFAITKADATISVTPYSVAYDGNAHTAIGTATGVGGANLNASLNLSGTIHTNAGDYPSDAWSFTGGINYNDANGTVHDNISKANATIVVNPYDVIYDGNAHIAAGTATGVKGESLSGLDLTDTTHTNAGTYTGDAWIFTDVTGNYEDESGTVDDNINKADATIDVSGYTGVYDGNAHGASGTATGVNSEDLSSLLHLGSTFTNVPGGMADWTFDGDTNYNSGNGSVAIVINKADSTTVVTCPVSEIYTGSPLTPCTVSVTGAGGLSLTPTPTYSDNTNAGTASASYTFVGDDNHNGSSGSDTFDITRADSTTVVTFEAGPYTYRGTAFTAAANVTGAGGLNESVAVVYSGDCTNVTVADGCTATATYVGDANHNGSSDSKTITITKADATIDVSGYTGVYDGNAHGASGTVKGVDGENLAGLVLGDSFTNVPGGTANWIFTDVTGNYNDDSGSVAIVITKADATITVNGYTGVYDAAAHGASGTATGVKGENLSSLLHLGSTFTKVPGGTADWTFDGDTNYNSDSGSVAIVINPYNFGGFGAPLTISSKDFKKTSTIPVKFKLFNTLGNPVSNAVASLQVCSTSGNPPSGCVNAVASGGSNTGNTFRYDPTGKQYIFNLSTKLLSLGQNILVATLDDGTPHSQTITVK